MKNRYKIDCHHDYDRIERPYGVFVLDGRIIKRWRYICAFKTYADAQDYIVGILDLPHEIFSGSA